uniref:Peptidase M24 domain-containing protein n=1 Tax=Saimiri boliviensis boliviensis TaxID=39432 RepID=A0A2K6V2E3_SAIBB
ISGEDKQQEQTIAKDLVVLWSLVEAFSSDTMIMEETGKVFEKKKKKEMKKGIAFPTIILVNNCVCHFSSLKSDQDYILKEGKLVKIDLGVHVNGFITNIAHTSLVDVAQGTQVTGRKADVIKTTHLCAEAALHLVKPSNQNTQETEAQNKASHSFNCAAIEGMLLNQLKQHNRTDQQKDHEKAEFEVHELYAVDRTTIYKRDPSKQYGLKMKTTCAFFSEMERHFHVRSLILRKKPQMGVVKCAKHELWQPFNVLYEKEGEFVAHFKFTVLLMPIGLIGPFKPDLYKSKMEVEDTELKALFQSSASQKTQKKKTKKVSKTAENATSEETEENEAGD